MPRTPNTVFVTLSLTILFLAAGCVKTRQTRNVETSGFLGDYTHLQEGEDGEALLRYYNPDVDWNAYDKVLVETVELLSTDELNNLPEGIRQGLCEYLFRAICVELQKDYEMVSNRGKGVMVVRTAITEADGARVLLNAATSLIPQTRLVAKVSQLSLDAAVLVGKTSVEFEILDGASGERMAAAVDRRAGTKSVRTAFTKWGDIQSAYVHWAERLRERLGEARNKTKS